MNNKTMKVITVVTGILTIILGLIAIAMPFRTFLAIGWIWGIMILINGVEVIAMAMAEEKKNVGACILGVLEVIGGLVLLCDGFVRFLTDLSAAYLVGFSIMLYGVFQIVKGIQLFKISKGTGTLGIICGILSVVIGIFAFMHPAITMLSVGYIIAFSVLMQGINMIVFAVAAAPAASEQ